MSALWIHEVAERFWVEAGGAPPGFLRDLREAASWALPIALVERPGLSIAKVDAWLAERQVEARLALPDRPLRACLVVYEASGLLFVDAADGVDERRFNLAHEVAHYLAEYAIPRERARERLGESVLPVLDGRRSATRDERLGAVLGGVSLGPCLHLMERTPDGHPAGQAVSAAEGRADELAFELLAPFEAVRAQLPEGAELAVVEASLREVFGLPPAAARAYARRLALGRPAGSLFRRLFSSV